MNLIGRYRLAIAWSCLIIGFLIAALDYRWALYAIPFYVVAGIFFLVDILEKRRKRDDG